MFRAAVVLYRGRGQQSRGRRSDGGGGNRQPTRFFCGGRLIFGPDVASLFLTMFLVAAPSIAFCLQAVVKIHKHEEIDSNHHNQILGFPVLIIAILVTVADLCFLVMTSSRDPGIIPRNPRAPDSAAFDFTPRSMEWTTYENFRYRYDKKENPYNKSLFGNVKDVFFSKIPPSLNDFRAWVLQDAIRDSASPDGLLEIVGIKEKVDLEMGNTNEFDGIKPIPSILQNSDYTAIEDNYLQKGKLKDDSSYRLAFPGNQEPIEEEPVYTKQSCTKADGLTMDERIDEESRSHESPCHPDHGDGRFLRK
ncbi:hypothetical protein ZIOFF_026706 [Zingiber officinale]|uniref:Uncharacterized protein n=1 Tax=Zingiber officinale TaxID=94328 RepID=A0A8J5H5I6_ZINOF|nr:hypothetical protein ZIOFF_026706 [Zingiber officinale]